MPKIVDYAVQTAVQPAGILPVADFGAPGRALQGVVDVVRQRQEENEISDLQVTLAQARAEWSVELEKRAAAAPLGDATFAQQFSQDLTNSLGELGGKYSTRAGRQRWQEGAARLSADMTQVIGLHTIESAAKKARADYTSALNFNRNTLAHDPLQFQSVMQDMLSALDDPAGLYARMPADAREKLKADTRQDLALSAVDGLARVNPDEALRQLKAGEWDQYVDADNMFQLQSRAESIMRAREIETNRAIIAAERAEKMASDAAMDRYIADVFSETPKSTAVDIATDKMLTPQAKLTMLGVLERSNKPDPLSQVSHETASELFRRIHLPDGHRDKITDETALNDAYIAERLSRTDLDWLRKDFQSARTPEGDALGRRRQAFFDAIEPQINSRGVWGLPTSSSGGERFYQFQEMARRKEDEYRKAGKDPHDLYDPASSDYLGRDDRVRSYKSPMTQQMDDLLQGIDLGTAAPTAIEQPAEETQAADVSRATATATGQDGRKIYLIDNVWQFATGQAVDTPQMLVIDGVEKPVQETKTVDGVTYHKVDGTWYQQ